MHLCVRACARVMCVRVCCVSVCLRSRTVCVFACVRACVRVLFVCTLFVFCVVFSNSSHYSCNVLLKILFFVPRQLVIKAASDFSSSIGLKILISPRCWCWELPFCSATFVDFKIWKFYPS